MIIWPWKITQLCDGMLFYDGYVWPRDIIIYHTTSIHSDFNYVCVLIQSVDNEIQRIVWCVFHVWFHYCAVYLSQYNKVQNSNVHISTTERTINMEVWPKCFFSHAGSVMIIYCCWNFQNLLPLWLCIDCGWKNKHMINTDPLSATLYHFDRCDLIVWGKQTGAFEEFEGVTITHLYHTTYIKYNPKGEQGY